MKINLFIYAVCLLSFSIAGCVVDDPVTDDNSLLRGQIMTPGQYLESSNGDYQLKLMKNGNLVLKDVHTSDVLWASNTEGQPVWRLILRPNGNLVLWGTSKQKLWETGTAASDALRLTINSDGSLVLYASDGKAIWTR